MEVTRTPRVRRARSLTETLLQIVLVLEVCLVFFATLVMFGLKKFDPEWMAFVWGGILFLVLVMLAGLQRHRWAVLAGGALQVVLIATGFLEPVLFGLGAGFALLWLYCFTKGRQIDTQKAAWLAQQQADTPATEGETP